ncbi:MAG: nicotinamide-nucleotide amidohydrolase family protein, partial [Pirellulaceae bacterium]|nr:nicotinamide-nucleotide amidohydrolase family protein [Pirellulaceae bacterium]
MSIPALVRRVAALLKQKNLKVVFAESCTGGLVAGSLTRVPGISDYHCGGMVVYRNATKQAYLGIPARLLKNPGPVSEVVAREMATRVLKLTPEADLSAAVTGHLGPGAPAELDGVVYMAIAVRGKVRLRKPIAHVTALRYQCRASQQRLLRLKEVVEE